MASNPEVMNQEGFLVEVARGALQKSVPQLGECRQEVGGRKDISTDTSMWVMTRSKKEQSESRSVSPGKGGGGKTGAAEGGPCAQPGSGALSWGVAGSQGMFKQESIWVALLCEIVQWFHPSLHLFPQRLSSPLEDGQGVCMLL